MVDFIIETDGSTYQSLTCIVDGVRKTIPIGSFVLTSKGTKLSLKSCHSFKAVFSSQDYTGMTDITDGGNPITFNSVEEVHSYFSQLGFF